MIKRAVLPDLIRHLSEPEMTILIGARQVGKTYLMRLLQTHLHTKGEKTAYLNLDIHGERASFRTQRSLTEYLSLHLGQTKGYVFIDEIQRKEDAGLFLKGLYDMGLPYKFIVSGSGSLDLKAKIKESLAGRKRLFVISPVSFEEFVHYKTDYRFEGRLGEFFLVEQAQTQRFLEEYLMFGGYPKVVEAQTSEKKKVVMDELYTSYIERDITGLLGVTKPDAFTDLLNVLASQIGSLVNFTELASTVGISAATVRQYLWYMEETYMITKLTPYYRNVRSEITKAPVYYFVDIGMRNYLLGLFGIPSLPSSLSGHLFENLLFHNLCEATRTSPARIHFWRTKDQAEVDFVLSIGLNVVPIEVKYTQLSAPAVERALRGFLARYPTATAYIIHLGKRMEAKVGQTDVHLVPFYEVIGEFVRRTIREIP